jgi:hypothetical protein
MITMECDRLPCDIDIMLSNIGLSYHSFVFNQLESCSFHFTDYNDNVYEKNN